MKTILAYRKFPLPHGTNYYVDDLSTKEQVEQLFDYCQILEAIIFREGWDHLIEKFGYNNLFVINRRSGWKDCETLDAFIQNLEYERNVGKDI